MDRTSLTISKTAADELRRAQLSLSVEAGRQLTLTETVSRLVEIWKVSRLSRAGK